MKIFNKIKEISDMSILVMKIELILSIGYFIMAFICKSTIYDAQSVVKEMNRMYDFINLGTINFVMSFIWGYIFDKKFKIK